MMLFVANVHDIGGRKYFGGVYFILLFFVKYVLFGKAVLKCGFAGFTLTGFVSFFRYFVKPRFQALSSPSMREGRRRITLETRLHYNTCHW